jgi:hypothetical protein
LTSPFGIAAEEYTKMGALAVSMKDSSLLGNSRLRLVVDIALAQKLERHHSTKSAKIERERERERQKERKEREREYKERERKGGKERERERD